MMLDEQNCRPAAGSISPEASGARSPKKTSMTLADLCHRYFNALNRGDLRTSAICSPQRQVRFVVLRRSARAQLLRRVLRGYDAVGDEAPRCLRQLGQRPVCRATFPLRLDLDQQQGRVARMCRCVRTDRGPAALHPDDHHLRHRIHEGRFRSLQESGLSYAVEAGVPAARREWPLRAESVRTGRSKATTLQSWLPAHCCPSCGAQQISGASRPTASTNRWRRHRLINDSGLLFAEPRFLRGPSSHCLLCSLRDFSEIW